MAGFRGVAFIISNGQSIPIFRIQLPRHWRRSLSWRADHDLDLAERGGFVLRVDALTP